MKRTFLIITLFSLNSWANTITCVYELREFHGGSYSVIGEIQNTDYTCDVREAKDWAHENCRSYLHRNRDLQCVFKGCFEDQFQGCSW